MERRTFLALLSAPFFMQPSLRRSRKKNTDPQATSRYIVSQAVRRAKAERWDAQPIGQLMGNIGQLLLGTPYVGGTLEGDGPEVCRLDLTGLDCVTYFENVLCLARVIKKRKPSFEALLDEITYTRYRGGVLDGYTSRLHYTADWIDDNIRKRVISDITPQLNPDPFPLDVHFMSSNPRFYKPLKDNPDLVASMAQIEQRINATSRTYVPKARIAEIESMLQTGDIVAITTSKKGLDYAHTGMVLVDEQGARHFMHASQQKKVVRIEPSLHSYVNDVRTHTGISVLRPLDVA
ncbi:MAG: DUF1460 domain-containing protein [Candidatus Kapabacteria bacterium]|nr:DUF1460 domain-containing protein [Candidatus Kapabacteria bacterium]